MKIQVNSDNSTTVDARLIRFVEGEVSRVLGRFTKEITRLEVHLSDVDNKKTGQVDKRCLIEVRPAGFRPRSASARGTEMAATISEALGKMRRSLTTFFGRKGRPAAAVSGPVSPARKTTAKKTTVDTKKRAAVKKAAVKKPAKISPVEAKKKGIYQARRKSWPNR